MHPVIVQVSRLYTDGRGRVLPETQFPGVHGQEIVSLMHDGTVTHEVLVGRDIINGTIVLEGYIPKAQSGSNPPNTGNPTGTTQIVVDKKSPEGPTASLTVSSLLGQALNFFGAPASDNGNRPGQWGALKLVSGADGQILNAAPSVDRGGETSYHLFNIHGSNSVFNMASQDFANTVVRNESGMAFYPGEIVDTKGAHVDWMDLNNPLLNNWTGAYNASQHKVFDTPLAFSSPSQISKVDSFNEEGLHLVMEGKGFIKQSTDMRLSIEKYGECIETQGVGVPINETRQRAQELNMKGWQIINQGNRLLQLAQSTRREDPYGFYFDATIWEAP
ncbi:MAG: hypothetical protein HQL13_08705 [Candidatus Omnitrophica bacterium]|nr:hypothetical protein [Candidatus Omnitrophota bacterium]